MAESFIAGKLGLPLASASTIICPRSGTASICFGSLMIASHKYKIKILLYDKVVIFEF